MNERQIKVLKTGRKEALSSYMASHPDDFQNILSIALADDISFAWRAAWLISSHTKKNDERIAPHIKSIINAIPGKKDGHQRELLRIIMRMELEEDVEGLLFDICISLWEDINKDPSIRITAFKLIMKTIKKYPELFEEIKFLTDDHYLEPLSPGIKKSVLKSLHLFNSK